MITDLDALAAEDRRDIPALVIPPLPAPHRWLVVSPIPALGGVAAASVAMLAHPAGAAARWHWLAIGVVAYLVMSWRELRARPAVERLASAATADLATGLAASGCVVAGGLAATGHFTVEHANPAYLGAASVAIVLLARAIGSSLRPRRAPVDLASVVQLVGVTLLITLFALLVFAKPGGWSELIGEAVRRRPRGLRLTLRVVELTSFELICLSASVAIAIARDHPLVAVLEHRGTLVAAGILGLAVLVVYRAYAGAHPNLLDRVVLGTSGALAVTATVAHVVLRRRRGLINLCSANQLASTASGS